MFVFAPGNVVVEHRTKDRDVPVLVMNGTTFVSSVITLEQTAVDKNVRFSGLP